MSPSHSLPTDSSSSFNFSIITVHNGSGDCSDPLFCSVASLADQEEVKTEQILQHTGSATGLWNKLSRELTLSKRASHYTLRLLEEKNTSFTEALHHAVMRTTGSVIGFLQPGEQYLPGALDAVQKEFQTHPNIDLLITSALVLDEKSKKITSLAATPFSLEYLWTCLPEILPSALFIRSSVLKNDTSFSTLSFVELLMQLLQTGKKISVLPHCTTFSQIGSWNIPSSVKNSAPVMMRLLRPWWQCRHNTSLRKVQAQLPPPCLTYQADSLRERMSLS